MHRRGFVVVVLTLGLVLAMPATLLGQEATGKVVGEVTDPQGAVVAGAKVAVTNIATNISIQTVTDKDGVYQALHLPIGSYRVEVIQPGFQKVVTTAQSLEINQTLRIDIKLQVSAATETVEVSGSTTQVETYNPTIGNSVTARPIVNMPLNGRNVLDLAKLEPGVSEANPGNGGAGTMSISGGRPDSVTYLLDGGLNNNLINNAVVFNPNPDTIAEFRILENNYGAEYGRNGGGIISVVTKSGTNEFHGSAFDFIRNDAFDANSFFNKRPLPGQDVTPRDALKRHQFGGTIGGPIKKDKLFWFFSYQGQRQTLGVTQPAQQVFTTRELNGDFSQSANSDWVASFLDSHPYYQPNAALAAQGIIDPSRIDAVAKAYIKAGLIPSSDSGYIKPSAKSTTNNNEYTAKIDYQITNSDRLSGTAGLRRQAAYVPFDGSDQTTLFADTNSINTYFANIAYTKTLSANLLNEFRFTAQRAYSANFVPSNKKLPTYKDLGINVSSDAPNGPPIVYFYDSGMNLGNWYQGPSWIRNNTFSYTDTLSWVKGKHNLKFGFMLAPYQNNTLYDYIPDGEFDFYGESTYYASGVEFADFLMGLPDEYYQYGRAPSNIRSKSWYGFAQDEWRVTRNLVLTFGLRYEYSSPKLDTVGRSFSIVPGAQSTRFVNAPPGLLFPGDQGAPKGANFPDRNDFAPRFGFAWAPNIFGEGKTSIRGGFGVFYDVLKGEDNLQFNGQPPFFGYSDFYMSDYDIAYEFTGASPFFSDPYGATGVVNPFPSKWPSKDVNFLTGGFLPFGGSSAYFVDTHLRTPYTYQYNLSIQQELAKDLRFEVAYVGSSSHKLTTLQDMNPIVLGTRNRVLNLQPGAINDTADGMWSWADAKTFRNAANAFYSSLQTSLKKQLSGSGSKFGATYFTLGYTFSRNIDNSSGFRNNGSRVPYYEPNIFRAASALDVQQRLTFSGGWDLPFQELLGGPKRLTKGWSVYPILTVRGGFPLDIYAPLSQKTAIAGPSGAGDSYLVRVNLVGNSVMTTSPQSAKTDPNTMGLIYFNGTPGTQFEWATLSAMNKSSFIPTAAQRTYGTLPRNYFRGPGRSNLDFSFAKVTPITERVSFEFRADFFNAFNHAEFNNPNVSATSDKFGEITSTADPRIIQFAGKITF